VRASRGNICYHAINRGNGRAEVFHKAADYQRFTEMMQQACERLPLRVVGWCLMPNHFHLVVWPLEDGDLSRWMQWLMTCHVRRYHRHYQSSGHVWQGRFKAFPIQEDRHFLTVLRYVERNPVRAGLVDRAEDWPWSSLHAFRQRPSLPPLAAGPVSRPRSWLALVNDGHAEQELERLRTCVNRGCPFGSATWSERVATCLGLEAATRPRGRPRKQPETTEEERKSRRKK
jgi:putative transposase